MRARSVQKRKTPACTHISMERIPLAPHDQFACPSCGNWRALGFLYICRQERDIAYLENKTATMSDSTHTKSALRQEMEFIGLSESVIKAAEQGLYTDRQLEKLKARKMELNRLRIESIQAAQMRDAIVHVSVDHDPEYTETLPTCQVLACHACRPYYKDRISMSFEAVFNDEIRPFRPSEANHLPVSSAQVLRNMMWRPKPVPLHIPIEETTPSSLFVSSGGLSDGTPSTPSQSSTCTYKTTQSEIDTMNITRLHRRRFYKMGRRSSGELGRDVSNQMSLFSRQGLKDALKGVFRVTAHESSLSDSNITLPMPHTATARDTSEISAIGEFDMGALRRVKRQKDCFDLRQDHRNAALAFAHDEPAGLMERRHSNGSDSSSESDGSTISLYSCVSDASEVEVEGGVALSEEAVETLLPDMINDPESIMTQA